MKAVTDVFDDVEEIAARNSWMHARDARAKIIVAVAFLVTLVSFESHAVSGILPLAFLLVFWLTISSISLRWLLRRLIFPVAVLSVFGLANMFFDKKPHGMLFDVVITGGFLSWCSIVLRASLSLGIALVLIATTGIVRLSEGLVALKVPRIFVTTLLLLYRYIFVLGEEASRLNRARISRAFGRKGMELSTASALLGQLLIRSLTRADDIHSAMLARGFGETTRAQSRTRWTLGDSLMTSVAIVFLLGIRFGDFPVRVGKVILGAFS